MLSRRTLVTAAAAMPATPPPDGKLTLCMHQTTTDGAGFRRSLEAYAKASIRYVEVIPALVDAFVKNESVAVAKRLIGDLGLKAVASGGVRGLVEPGPDRVKALDELKFRAGRVAELGIDRMVIPCAATARYSSEDYTRGVNNARQIGEVVKPFGVTAMLEFMRGSTFAGCLPTALRITREANHPFFRPMLDFYHFWAGLSKLEDLDMLHPGEVHHVHFQDVPAIPRELLDNSSRDIPGDGVAPLGRMLKAVKRVYSGPLSVELFYPRLRNGDPYEVTMEIGRKSRAVLREAGMM